MQEEKTPPVAIAGWQATEGAVMRSEAAKRNDTPRKLDSKSTTDHEENLKIDGSRLDKCSSDVTPDGLDETLAESYARKMRALAAGNLVRIARGNIKKRLRSGELEFDDLLDTMPAEIVKVPVKVLVTWAPGVGKDRARRILDGLVHTDSLPVGDLSPRTKRLIGGRVDRYVQKYRGAPYAVEQVAAAA